MEIVPTIQVRSKLTREVQQLFEFCNWSWSSDLEIDEIGDHPDQLAEIIASTREAVEHRELHLRLKKIVYWRISNKNPKNQI